VHKVELTMKYYSLEDDFYVTSIGRANIFLGIQWLISIETYYINHQRKFLSLRQYGCEVTLKILEPKSIQIVDSKHMSKILKKVHFGFMICLYYMEETPSQQTYASSLSSLSWKYKVVFQDILVEHPPKKDM